MKRLIVAVFLLSFLVLPLNQNSGAVSTPTESLNQNIAEKYSEVIADIEIEIIAEDGRKLSSFTGSAFCIDAKNGYFLTANHVVNADLDDLALTLGLGQYQKKVWIVSVSKNKKFLAEITGYDQLTDSAVCRVKDLPPNIFKSATLGNSEKSQPGDVVYTYGSPAGLSGSIAYGLISSVHRLINMNYIEDFIQTSSPINSGNSGCPLINSNGEVIGIVTAKIGNADGLGFVVPIHLVNFEKMKSQNIRNNYFGAEALLNNLNYTSNTKADMNDLIPIYKLSRISNLSDLAQILDFLKNPDNSHALIIRVNRGSPADQAGLKLGDIVIKANGQPIKNGMDLRRALLETSDEVIVLVVRIIDGTPQKVQLKVRLISASQEELSLNRSGDGLLNLTLK